MALLGKVELQSGISVDNAYQRISTCRWGGGNILNATIEAWVSEAYRSEGKMPLTQLNQYIEIDLNNLESPLTQAFNQLRAALYQEIKKQDAALTDS